MIKDNIKDKTKVFPCYRMMISIFMDRSDELPFASLEGRFYAFSRSDTCLLPCRNVFRVNRMLPRSNGPVGLRVGKRRFSSKEPHVLPTRKNKLRTCDAFFGHAR